MRIIFWDPLNSQFLGGAQIVIAQLREELQKLGVKSFVASFDGNDLGIGLPKKLASMYPSHNLNLFSPFINSLQDRITRTEPDIIYVMSPILMGPLLYAVRKHRIRKRTSRPVTVMDMGVLETDLSGIRQILHLPQYIYYLAVHRYYYSLLNKFDYINSSSLTNRYFLENCLKTPSQKIFTINTNLVPDSWFQSSGKSYQKDRLMIFSPGRVELIKGYPTLLRATDLLVHKYGHDEIRIFVINNGRYIKDLKEFVTKHELAKNFIIMERITIAQLKNMYLRSMVVPVPYMHANVYSQVICEGMATSNVVIASKIGAFKEIIRDGENGYLVDLGNADQLAEKMHFVLTHEDIAKSLQKKATETAFEKCRLSGQASCLLRKLVDIIENTSLEKQT